MIKIGHWDLYAKIDSKDNKPKQLDENFIKLFIQAVPTGLGFATRNYLGAK